MSMYRQLWLAIIVSTLLSMGGALFASLLSARGYLESQLSIKNTDNATALALSLSQSNPDPVMADLVVASLFDGGHYELIRITDPKGNLITERTAPTDDLDAPGWFVKALPLQASAGTAQVSSGWKQFGTVTLVSHSRFVYGALWKSAYEMVLALSLAGLVGGYLAALVLRRLRVPLNAVIDQAEAIMQRRFVSIELPAVPELRQLAVAMNATVGRLKAMFEEEAGRLETVRREANFDALTGLANRTHFMARLRQFLESEDSLGGSLLLIRLADLVGINRRLGRGVTDDFLRQVGDIVNTCAGLSPFNFSARLNGGDFAVLLGHEEDGRVAADKLLAALVGVATPFVEGDVVGWIGVGRFKQGTDMGTLLARVDMALAGVEAEGANAVREAPMDEVEELPRTAQQWSFMIRRALEQGWVRLISFPVVDAQRQLSHRECPLRLMFDETGDWLPAGRFLPAAERLKLTPALDLAAVALGLKELQSKPQLKGLAINLSASSVKEASFRKDLIILLTGQKEVTSRLWLEVAEVGALKHLAEFRELCRSLKTVGCRVGLEHYGHQFSQIGSLHDLGLDFLKVDSSFVRGVDSNAGNVAFLKGLCSISHNIGLQVLAEGVATQAEWMTLISLGFDGATGPLIQEPPQ
jgi:predicted signal transduction protein with EAL and GGDEF domain